MRSQKRLGGSHRAQLAPRSGFTLIELILVMAMLLTVLALAAPSLVRFFRGRNLEAEARRLLALTRYGQSRAVSEGVPMLLWLNAESNQYGLRIDPSFVLLDTNALQFDWNERVRIEAGVSEFATNLRPWQISSLLSDRMVKLYFQPDGSISDLSPPRLRLEELRDQNDPAGETDGEIWLTQSPNRLRYEIPEVPPLDFRR